MPGVESLSLTPPSGSSISLSGTKWGLLDFDLGNPPRRDELVTGQDASGSVPFRVAPRDNREVNLRLQLLDAADMNAALDSIGELEKMLERAEQIAADGPVDPVADSVRLVYTPVDSTRTFSLPVITGEITGVPKTTTGDDAGFYIRRPIVTVKLVCEPFAYGTNRVYLDTTTTGQVAPSVTVAGGPGDVSPWIRTAFKDVSTQTRGRLIVGVRQGESAATASLPASGWTAIAGTFSTPYMSTSSTDIANWQTLAQIPRQTRFGGFRVYAHRLASNGGATTGQIRLAWTEAGSSLRRTSPVSVPVSLSTVYLGEVNATAAWDGWLETKGAVSLTDLILIPTDSYLETTAPTGTDFMTGARAAEDALQSTSTHIGGRSLTVGGTWSTTNSASPTWPVSAANWARRTAVSMGTTPALAQAGTSNHIAVDVRATIRVGAVTANDTLPMAGVYARWVDTGNYLVFGPRNGAALLGDASAFRLVMVLGTTPTVLWSSDLQYGDYSSGESSLRLQVTADGRWAVWAANGGREVVRASGQHFQLAQGATLGNAGAAKAGLFDLQTSGTANSRDFKDFSIAPLVGVTPAPIPSGTTLTQSGVRLRNSDGADYTYVGSSGLTLRPNVNNNLTVACHRSAGVMDFLGSNTDPLDIDIDGYPRFLSVPHT